MAFVHMVPLRLMAVSLNFFHLSIPTILLLQLQTFHFPSNSHFQLLWNPALSSMPRHFIPDHGHRDGRSVRRSPLKVIPPRSRSGTWEPWQSSSKEANCIHFMEFQDLVLKQSLWYLWLLRCFTSRSSNPTATNGIVHQ